MKHRNLAMCVAMTIVAAIAVSSTARADDNPGMHRFYLLYAVVNHLQEKDSKRFDVAMAFIGASPKAAHSLAEFWWAWGIRDCMPSVKEMTSTLTPKATDKEQQERIKKEMDNCVSAFIFQHWEDINESIENKFAGFPTDNPELP